MSAAAVGMIDLVAGGADIEGSSIGLDWSRDIGLGKSLEFATTCIIPLMKEPFECKLSMNTKWKKTLLLTEDGL